MGKFETFGLNIIHKQKLPYTYMITSDLRKLNAHRRSPIQIPQTRAELKLGIFSGRPRLRSKYFVTLTVVLK